MAPSITAGMIVPASASYRHTGMRSDARRSSGGNPFAGVRLAHINSASRTSFMRAANAIPLARRAAARPQRAPPLHGEQGGLLMRLCGRRFDKHVAAVEIRSGRCDSSRTCHRARGLRAALACYSLA